MRFTCHWANGVARAGLAAGLVFLVSQTSSGQEGPTGGTPPPAATATQAPPAKVEPAPSGADQPPAGESAKPFWATNPPVTVFPRPGNFIIPPTGPGYYSAWDWIIGNERDNPPKFPYGPISICPFPFFDADFRYLDDPANTQHDWLDFTKRMHFGDCWLLSIGGEERFRYMNEVDSRLNKAGLDNTYELMRSRVYTDLWYGNVFRVYAELLAANTYNQDLPPAPIDQVRPTMLNLFADLKIFELDGSPVYLRGGRQELLYGSERLISPLDWANTLRTFQGVKGFRHTEKLDIDAFWVQPVVLNPLDFHDGGDGKQNFEGLWMTYRPEKGQFLDFYYLNLDNVNKVARGTYGDVDGYNVNTFGVRYAGDRCNFLWDGEGMFQFGDWANQVIAAGAATIGGGYNFPNVPMNPTFWIYFDWAEGDPHPGIGNVHRTFNQLFPFGHYYFGGIDLIGRQNINDLNLHFYFWPTRWIVTGIQYHILHLDSPKDSLYNSGGTAILGTTLTGTARAVNGEATDVGDELTLYTNFHLSPHQDIWLQYCKLYAGNFLTENKRGSPSVMSFQYSFRW